MEALKRADKGLQTVGLEGGPVGVQGKVLKMEVLKGDAQIQPKKKKRKQKKKVDPNVPVDPNAIPEEEESYYEYYEEEVDPSEISQPALSGGGAPSLNGIGGYAPVYVNNPKKA